MKEKILKPGTNFLFIIGTLIFFVLCYLVYLQYYIPNKESKIIATRFRVLDQMGDNINAKVVSYQNNAFSFNTKIEKEAFKLTQLLQKSTKQFSINDIVEYLLLKLADGSYKKFFNEDLQFIYYVLNDRKTFAKEFETNRNAMDKYFLLDPVDTDLKIDTKINKGSVGFGVRYDNIMKGLIRDDVFDQIFIVRINKIDSTKNIYNKKVVFSTLKADLILEVSKDLQGELAFSLANNQKSKFGEAEKSSDIKPEARLISGEYSDLTISNEDYKLFLKPVNIKSDYWYIGGLVKAENFHGAARSIDQWIVILLSLVLIFIILGLPLIKLKVVSKTDELKTGSIINSTLAILLGTSFISLFIFYLSQNILQLLNTDEKLENLSFEINSSLTKEMKVAFKQLISYDSLYVNNRIQIEEYRLIKDKDPTGQANGYIENILDSTTHEFSFPKSYPFLDYVFWLNKNGRQDYTLTPFNEISGEKSDLSYRDYFKKKDEWFFPSDSTESTKKFRMESIVSMTSGNHLVAMSAPGHKPGYPVIALTSQFYSIIDPILPRNYGFCIVDDKGKVWFHSNKERNLMENFVSECNDNKNLKAAFYNRAAIPINVKYYNNPHRIYIKPLKNLPLYLVTFYSKNTDSLFQAQVFTITLIFVALFFLLIILQIAILLILDRFFLWKLMRNLILNITRPRVHLARQNIFLMRLYFVVVIVSSMFVSFMGNFQSLAFIFVSEIIIFVFSFWVLNDNDLKRKQLKWFFGINLGILILLNILVFNIIKFSGLVILGYEIGLIVFLLISYRIFKQNKSDRKYELNKAFIRNYVLLLICFALFFSIFPSIIFYEIAYNEESNIHTRHYQIDAMKKREIRNTKWNNYYTSLTNISSSRPILQKRKNKGIYTKFRDDLEYVQEPDSVLIYNREPLKSDKFDEFITLLRPFYNDENIEDKFLLYDDQKNDNTSWINTGDDSMVLRYISNTEDPLFSKQDTMFIKAKADRLNFLTPIHGKSFTGIKKFIANLIMWIFLLSTLYIFYHLIRFGLRSIYSMDILLRYYPESFGKLITQRLLANKNIFIVKQSHFDSSKELLKSVRFDVVLDWSDANFVEKLDNKIDEFIKTTKAEHAFDGDTDNEITKPGLNIVINPVVKVFIDNFELEYNTPSVFNEKLNKLLMLVKQKNYKIIIISNLNPAKINAIHNTDEKTEDGSNEIISFENNRSLLETLFNNVVINYLPVKCSIQNENMENNQKYEGSKLEIVDLINAELNGSDYLLQFKNTLIEYYKESVLRHNLDNPEELILEKINTLAGNYYEELYRSCTADELYVVFDLADDLIINQKNKEVISALLDKGILVKKIDRISFLNISFRRFILSKRNKSTIKELEEKIGKESSPWQGYRIVLMLVVVSIFIFIALANQDLMKNISQLFVMIGGALATITGLFGMIAGKRKSEDS